MPYTFIHVVILCLSICFMLVPISGCSSKPTVTDAKGQTQTADDPKVIKPNVKRIWIPRRIEPDGKVMEDGHWRFEIIGGSTWSN